MCSLLGYVHLLTHPTLLPPLLLQIPLLSWYENSDTALTILTNIPKMKDLLVYEDFISKYDTILKDGYVFKCNPHRRSWERDCELLANSFLSKSAKLELTKRALTFEDLLMKVYLLFYPIIRDYSLIRLLANSKNLQIPAFLHGTPSCDSSH